MCAHTKPCNRMLPEKGFGGVLVAVQVVGNLNLQRGVYCTYH